MVDYERGRTKQEWVPRKLGGGKGDKRRDRETERTIRDLKKRDPLLVDKSRSRSAEKVVPEVALAAIKSENNVSLVKEELKTSSALGATQSAPAEVRKNGTETAVKEEVPPPVDRSRSRSREGKKEKKKDHHRRHHSSSSESDYNRHRHKDSKKEF